MKNYDDLRNICEKNSRISARVVDDYLIAYAAGHHGLGKQMEKRFASYRHVGKKLGKENLNMLKSQYLVHRVFQQEGLLGKFLKHPALGRFTGDERDFLMQQLKEPWRFSFSRIVDEPAEDFYTMEDVFTGERYLLYSPGVTRIRSSASPLLWFNLIGFNGSCWQSYGPVVYYNSFEAGDIWFFATELNPGLEEPGEVPADVERNPLPYMMLISGSTLPLTFHKEDQLLFLLAEHDLNKLDTAVMKKSFKSEYDQGVYRLTLKQWGQHPHFAQIFFDEEEQLLLFSAMTHRGFTRLVEAFNAAGHAYPAEPYLEVNMTMLSTASEILQKDIVLNEYLDLFQLDSDPESEKILEDINAFIALVIPDINAGIEPDIEEAARKTGVDLETARSVVESLMGNLDSNPKADSDKAKTGTGKPPKSKRKQVPVTRELPPQPKEGIRLLGSDDELLLDLHLYMLADDLRRMAPWEFYPEDEFFGVQVPGKDLIYFIHVMGQNRQLTGLAFYKGWEGLHGYLDFRWNVEHWGRQELSEQQMELAHTMPWGPLAIPHIMLSYVDREDLGPKERAVIKKSGVSFRGKGHWPRFEEIVPGFIPAYPGKETLAELYLVMQQVRQMLERVKEADPSLEREDDPPTTILIRVPDGKGPKFRWKDHYLVAHPGWGRAEYPVDIPIESRLKLENLPEANQELQIDMFFLPAPVREKGSRPYFPLILLMVDAYSGMVTSTTVHAPLPDLHSLYESIPQKVLDELLKLGHKPSEIQIRSLLLLGLLKEMLEESACPVVLEEDMPAMDEIITSMISHMS